MAKKSNPILVDNFGKVMMLPFRPESEPTSTDVEMTSHPVLPCVIELEMQDEVVRLLVVPIREHVHASWRYSIIPAIKYVRGKTGWGLNDSKDYVDKIEKEFAGQISAARVVSSQ